AFADGEEIPNHRLQQPRAEGEIAFWLGADLIGPKLTIAEVIAAVALAVPAIEIVASRIADWNIGILDTIADNASAGLYVLGTTPRALADFDPVMCGMMMTRNGVPVSTGIGAACLGNPLTATLWLARKMLEVGRPLLRGDVILSGALGPMVPVKPGDSIEVRISGVGGVTARISD
ncbi:MAG: fumarylacetoacetate hydrolase family protein, partial [Rhodospirillales bacterium]|nr:fumarylacetoacetate hydrolase family protein [Rhodospirillales bacterium]